MKINKNSWHYKVYAWTYEWGPPSHTNLCSYVQRMFWRSLWKVLYGTVVYLLYFLVMTPVAFLFGNRPSLFDKESSHYDQKLFKKYRGWYAYGFELYPGYILLPIALLYGEYQWWKHGLFTATVVHIMLALIVLGLFVLVILPDTDTGKLIIAWLSAKKQGVCPLVEFQDVSDPPDAPADPSIEEEIVDADILESIPFDSE